MYNYLKPQHYYLHLFLFFSILSFSLTFSLFEMEKVSLDLFLFQFIIIFFLLIAISALVEHFYKGEYMGPLEIYDVESFFNDFLKYSQKEKIFNDKYFNKYDSKSRQVFSELFKGHKIYFLSSIRKNQGVYEITFIDEIKFTLFFVIKFLIRHPIHKVYVQKNHNKYKIIRLV